MNIIDKVLYDIKDRGIFYLLPFYGGLALSLIFEYPVQLLCDRRIVVNDMEHKYLVHWYNVTYINERAIEVPISLSYCCGDILEVGNVLSHYVDFKHDVVDKYEIGKGIINEDIVDYSPGKLYDSIICISTLEHIGWEEEERDPQKIFIALDKMKSLLKPKGVLIVTVPVGWNPFVNERMIRERFTDVFCFHRTSRYDWVQCKWHDTDYCRRWGDPYPYANDLMIGIYKKD
jgi:hypothetical protein